MSWTWWFPWDSWILFQRLLLCGVLYLCMCTFCFVRGDVNYYLLLHWLVGRSVGDLDALMLWVWCYFISCMVFSDLALISYFLKVWANSSGMPPQYSKGRQFNVMISSRFYFIFEFCVSCVFEHRFVPVWAQVTWSSQERSRGSGAGVEGSCGQLSLLPRMILCKSSVACNHRGPLPILLVLVS